jgi:hypothetical protein
MFFCSTLRQALDARDSRDLHKKTARTELSRSMRAFFRYFEQILKVTLNFQKGENR